MSAAIPFIMAANSIAGLAGMDKQNQLNRENMALAQDYWEKQFNMTNAYNKPSKVVGRYLEGGIHPSAAFGGSSVGQSAAVPSAPNAPALSFPPSVQNGAQMFSTIAQALSSLGSAYKNTAEGHSILSMLEDNLKGVQIDNSIKQFALELDKMNLDKKQKAEIQMYLSEAAKNGAMVTNLNEDELLKMEQRFKTIQERINEITKGQILSNEATQWMKTWEMNMNEARSRIYFNYKHGYSVEKQGDFYGASAERESFFNQLRADPQARDSLLEEIRQKGKQAVLNKKLSEQDLRKLTSAANMAAFADDMKEFEYGWNKAESLMRSAGIVLKSMKPY